MQYFSRKLLKCNAWLVNTGNIDGLVLYHQGISIHNQLNKDTHIMFSGWFQQKLFTCDTNLCTWILSQKLNPGHKTIKKLNIYHGTAAMTYAKFRNDCSIHLWIRPVWCFKRIWFTLIWAPITNSYSILHWQQRLNDDAPHSWMVDKTLIIDYAFQKNQMVFMKSIFTYKFCDSWYFPKDYPIFRYISHISITCNHRVTIISEECLYILT